MGENHIQELVEQLKNNFGDLFKCLPDISLACSLDIQVCSQLFLDEFISLGVCGCGCGCGVACGSPFFCPDTQTTKNERFFFYKAVLTRRGRKAKYFALLGNITYVCVPLFKEFVEFLANEFERVFVVLGCQEHCKLTYDAAVGTAR